MTATFDQLKAIESQLELSAWLSPLNLSEQRERFLANPSFNPTFAYPEVDTKKLQELLLQLSHLKVFANDELEQWVAERKIKQLELEITLILNRGTLELSEVAKQLYTCTFGDSYIKQAEVDATLEAEFKGRESKSAIEVIKEITKYLKKYHLDDWSVALSDQSDFYFRVKAAQKTILMSRNFNWDFTSLDTALAHEIDGHVIRAVNASHQEKAVLKKPLPFYLKTEEGLASFLGDYCSVNSEVTLKHHALKYLAGKLAITSSFLEVFEFLCDHGFTSALAFQRTFRLKRGLSDTAKPGCFAKEAVYYEGMLEVKAFLDNGGDVKLLLAGKVGLEDLPYIELPEFVIIPDRLKKYLATKNSV